MGIGATARWRAALSGDVLKRLKLQMRQITSSSFPREISDLWISPCKREGFEESSWKEKPGFLAPAEASFVGAIEALESQDQPGSAPLDFVQACLAQANRALGHNFNARASSADESSLKGCIVIDHIWKHVDSYTILKDEEPWILELKDEPSGQVAKVPMIACIMYECLLDDCD